MKKNQKFHFALFLSLLLGVVLFWGGVVRAAPGGIDRQIPVTGRLVTSTGDSVADGQYRMRLRIFDASIGGTQLFEELFDDTTDYGSGVCPSLSIQNGAFLARMGACNEISTSAFQALFNNTELHLEVSLDIDEDGTYEEVFDPRRKLTIASASVSALQLVSSGDGVNTSNLFIDDSGHLLFGGVGQFGIGMSGSVPQSSIEVFDGGLVARAHLYGVGDGTNYSEFTLGSATQSSSSWNFRQRMVGGQDGDFTLDEDDGLGGSNQRLVINPGGNVGVGPLTTAEGQFSINESVGGVFDALRITNSAIDGDSQISFEEGSEGQSFSIRYRGSQDQLEFVGIGGNETLEIDSDDGDIFTQNDFSSTGSEVFVQNDVAISGEDIFHSSGDMNLFSQQGDGNTSINFTPGGDGSFIMNLSSNGGVNSDCFSLNNDSINRVRYNCDSNELEINGADFFARDRMVFNQWILLTTTDTAACPDLSVVGNVPGISFANAVNCGSSFLGVSDDTDGAGRISWGVQGLDSSLTVDYQGIVRTIRYLDTDDNTYLANLDTGDFRFNDVSTANGVYLGGTDFTYWIDNVGNTRSTGNHIINQAVPVHNHIDSNNRTAFTYVNSNFFFVLRGCGTNDTTWCQTGGSWPLAINLENNAATLGGNVSVAGAISKASGTFDIKHPNPALQSAGWRLRHSFVESPTRGDNIYRYEVAVEAGEAVVELPDYYKYLNENSQVWVSPIDNFGSGTGIVDDNLESIAIEADSDGMYSVLVIGTRKDEDARVFDEKGVEYQSEDVSVDI